jgi:hypothetical protein
MLRKPFDAPLTALLLAGLVTVVSAQDDASRENGTLPGEVLTCNVSSASRTRETCGVDEAGQTIVRTEREVTRTFGFAPPPTLECESNLDLEYFQRDTIARVKGMIQNETCGASSGQYDIEAEVKYENGETKTLVFNESWWRDDDQPVAVTAEYPIGENVELIRIRSRRLQCVCAEEVEDEPGP